MRRVTKLGNDLFNGGRYNQNTNPPKIQIREDRVNLKLRGHGYFLPLLPRVAIGYKRCKNVGRWVIRIRRFNTTTARPYIVRTFALADDLDQPDGKYILSFKQAQTRALEWSAAYSATGRFPLEPEYKQPQIPTPAPSSQYTFAHAARDYYRWRQISGRETFRQLYTWRTYIEPEFNTVVIDELKAKQVWDWFERISNTASYTNTPWGRQPLHSGPPKTLEARRRRQRTANAVLVEFRAILNHAYVTGRVDSKSAWDRVKNIPMSPRPRQRILSVEECERLLQACQPDLRRLIEVGLLTGCRFGEVKRLRVDDFLDESGKLFIQLTKLKRSRHVTLTERGIELFTLLLASRRPGDYILSPSNAERWSTRRYYHRLQRAAQRADIPPPINFQLLRRTYASHAAMAGVPLTVIANQLGHANTITLEQHYLLLSDTYIDEVIRKNMPDLA